MYLTNIINCERFNQVKYQVIASIAANIGCMGQGCSIGWFSPAMLLLRSESTPLATGPLSANDSGWLASFLAIGAIVGVICSGILCNYIGSKQTMLVALIPGTISWLTIVFAESVFHIGISRFLAGIATGGVFTGISVFVAEIAEASVRGRLVPCSQLSFYTGVMLGYAFGANLNYYLSPFIFLIWPAICVCSLIPIPSTPLYFLRINDMKKAEESLRFYRNCPSVEPPQPTDQRELQLIEEFLRLKIIAKQWAESPKLNFSDFTTLAATKGLFIPIALFFVGQFSGTITVSSFAATIFRETGTTIDPNVSSIIMGSMQIIGILCAALTIDRLGRKVLLLVSTTGAAIGLSVTGVYSYLHNQDYDVAAFSVVPVISVSFFMLSVAFGLTPVPFVIMSELLPPKIKPLGAPLVICSFWIYVLVMVKIFPLLLVAIKLHGCMWAFSCVAVGGLIFTALFVPETKRTSTISA